MDTIKTYYLITSHIDGFELKTGLGSAQPVHVLNFTVQAASQEEALEMAGEMVENPDAIWEAIELGTQQAAHAIAGEYIAELEEAASQDILTVKQKVAAADELLKFCYCFPMDIKERFLTHFGESLGNHFYNKFQYFTDKHTNNFTGLIYMYSNMTPGNQETFFELVEAWNKEAAEYAARKDKEKRQQKEREALEAYNKKNQDAANLEAAARKNNIIL